MSSERIRPPHRHRRKFKTPSRPAFQASSEYNPITGSLSVELLRQANLPVPDTLIPPGQDNSPLEIPKVNGTRRRGAQTRVY